MTRPDPIEYAERLYEAICDANFSPISFLTFGNAVKDGVPFRSMPRIAAEPFMRIVGDMLELEEEVAEEDDLADAEVVAAGEVAEAATPSTSEPPPAVPIAATAAPGEPAQPASTATASTPPEEPAGQASPRGKRGRQPS
jgi:hypothetical protein